ncbi:MAG: NAD-binding protein, partial [Clostridia bacterium]|nr:NAD-binding protein [Clostridia bacterium]
MKKKSILLIGLGRFGKHIAMKLNELGHEIMAVDHDEEKVNEIMPIV